MLEQELGILPASLHCLLAAGYVSSGCAALHALGAAAAERPPTLVHPLPRLPSPVVTRITLSSLNPQHVPTAFEVGERAAQRQPRNGGAAAAGGCCQCCAGKGPQGAAGPRRRGLSTFLPGANAVAAARPGATPPAPPALPHSSRVLLTMLWRTGPCIRHVYREGILAAACTESAAGSLPLPPLAPPSLPGNFCCGNLLSVTTLNSVPAPRPPTLAQAPRASGPPARWLLSWRPATPTERHTHAPPALRWAQKPPAWSRARYRQARSAGCIVICPYGQIVIPGHANHFGGGRGREDSAGQPPG